MHGVGFSVIVPLSYAGVILRAKDIRLRVDNKVREMVHKVPHL